MLIHIGKEKKTLERQRKAKRQRDKHAKKQDNQESWLKTEPFEAENRGGLYTS